MVTPSPLHLLIVDDHPVVRVGMAQLLRSAFAGCEVSEADSAATAQALLAHRPDVTLVLLDVHLPGTTPLQPLQALHELRSGWPLLPVLLMSADSDPQLAARAIDAGAAGWLPKSAQAGVLMGALELVLAGGCYLPPFLLGRAGAPAEEALTPRQAEVLAELALGRSNKEIARALGMSEPTVKGHLVTIFRVLRVRNRAEAAVAGQALLASARF